MLFGQCMGLRTTGIKCSGSKYKSIEISYALQPIQSNRVYSSRIFILFREILPKFRRRISRNFTKKASNFSLSSWWLTVYPSHVPNQMGPKKSNKTLSAKFRNLYLQNFAKGREVNFNFVLIFFSRNNKNRISFPP
jgi:hypothetical protein